MAFGAKTFNCLTNPGIFTVPDGGVGGALWFIAQMILPTGAIQALASPWETSYLIGFRTDRKLTVYNGTWGDVSGSMATNALQEVRDYLWAGRKGVQTLFYTNGVATASGGFLPWAQGICLGSRPSFSNSFNGYILEFGMLTNFPTAATVSNLHWYATNTYTITP